MLTNQCAWFFIQDEVTQVRLGRAGGQRQI